MPIKKTILTKCLMLLSLSWSVAVSANDPFSYNRDLIDAFFSFVVNTYRIPGPKAATLLFSRKPADIKKVNEYAAAFKNKYRKEVFLKPSANDELLSLLEEAADLALKREPDKLKRLILDNLATINHYGHAVVGGALSVFIREGDMEMVEAIISAGYMPEDSYGLFPLDLARLHGQQDVIELLLKYNCTNQSSAPSYDYYMQEHYHPLALQNPLFMAIIRGDAKTVKKLIAAGHNVNEPLPVSPKYTLFESMLKTAFIHAKKDIVIAITKAGGLGFNGELALEFAIAYARLDIVKCLIRDAKQDIHTTSSNQRTLLTMAALSQNLNFAKRAVELLLSLGADVNKANGDKLLPLTCAVLNGNVEAAKILIAHGADVNKTEGDILPHLLIAIEKHPDNLELIKTLIAHGADVNKIHYDYVNGKPSQYSLVFAISKHPDNLELIKTLIAHGADVDNTRGSVSPSLVSAILYDPDNLELIETLIAHGADVNRIFSDLTPLGFAIKMHPDNLKLIKTLIAHGADVNRIYEGFDMMPLSQAVATKTDKYYMSEQDLQRLVECLLDNGADIRFKNKRGLTAFDYAKDNPKISAAILNRLDFSKDKRA